MVQYTASPGLLETLYYLSTFLSFASELDSLFSSEYLDQTQNLILSNAKVSRLESFLGHHHTTNITTLNTYSAANAEREEFNKKLESLKKENRELKQEITKLNEALSEAENVNNR